MVGCAQVLGLPAEDEIESAARAFCKCEDLGSAWPGEGCESHVEGRLATASPEVRSAWLDLFTAERCERCDNAAGRALCAGTAPLCVNTAGACGTTEVCCLADGDSVYCGGQGVCVKDPEGCLESDSVCEPGVTTCCGEAGQLAGCVPSGDGARCQESCDPADDGNCKGCCVRTVPEIEDVPQGAASLCLPKETDCSAFCNLDGTGKCQQGSVCMPLPVYFESGQEGWVDSCMRVCNPLDGEIVGSPCTSTVLGTPDVPGCCANVRGPSGPDVVCAITNRPCTDFCNADLPQGCNCGAEEVPVTNAKLTVDVCLP